MSLGLGRVERAVLTVIEGGQLLVGLDVARHVFGHPVPTAAEYSSTCRALVSLQRKGLADANGLRQWGTPEAVQRQRRLRLPIDPVDNLK